MEKEQFGARIPKLIVLVAYLLFYMYTSCYDWLINNENADVYV